MVNAVGTGDRSAVTTLTAEQWELASSAPNAYADAVNAGAALAWRSVAGACTVGAALRQWGELDIDHPPDIDALDWWWRIPFAARSGPGRSWLRFGGIATLAHVWLNGELLFSSSNMFRSQQVEITDRLAAQNSLVIVCRSVAAALAQRRPRPRWRAPMIAHQQLRWVRTSLLGRMPGWTPAVPVIGPYRAITLEQRTRPMPTSVHLRTRVNGQRGEVAIATRIVGPGDENSFRVALRVRSQRGMALANSPATVDNTLASASGDTAPTSASATTTRTAGMFAAQLFTPAVGVPVVESQLPQLSAPPARRASRDTARGHLPPVAASEPARTRSLDVDVARGHVAAGHDSTASATAGVVAGTIANATRLPHAEVATVTGATVRDVAPPPPPQVPQGSEPENRTLDVADFGSIEEGGDEADSSSTGSGAGSSSVASTPSPNAPPTDAVGVPVGRTGAPRAASVAEDPRVASDTVARSDGNSGSTFDVLLPLTRDGEVWRGVHRLPKVERWWPHTHGAPVLYDCSIVITLDDGAYEIAQAPIGFRSIDVDRSGGGFCLRVNGVEIFARGAVWMPIDSVTLDGDNTAYVETIGFAAAAGLNMLRVPGTTAYETAAFYRACDAAGMMVWQDFAYANMDYPETEAFATEARAEANEWTRRLGGHACVALWCGNSEVEQQAAMFGAPRTLWQPALFHLLLSEVVASNSDVAYVASSATGGAFPHQADRGPTSYYGVGAYLRPLADARRAQVRFASECLAFANVPSEACIGKMPGGHALRSTHPAWKARTPRDLGAGWDFEDVRDHYLRALFAEDPARLRAQQYDRYLALSRVVTGEVMLQTLQEWRRAESSTRGALVLMLRDLVPGAGWGIIDATGAPKAAYYYVARACAPVAIAISDEGGNGAMLSVHNDSDVTLRGELRLTLWRGVTQVETGLLPLELGPRASTVMPAALFFGHFVDTTYAYRFGPVPFDVMHARLVVNEVAPALASLLPSDAVLPPASAMLVSDSPTTPVVGCTRDAYYFPVGLQLPIRDDLQLTGHIAPLDASRVRERATGATHALTLTTSAFAQSVEIEVAGYLPLDNYLHVAPHAAMTVLLRPLLGNTTPPTNLTLTALNCSKRVTVVG